MKLSNQDNTMESHNHNDRNLSTSKFVAIVIANSVITLSEVVGGIFSGSLALFSDALHNLNDVTAVTLSFIAGKIAVRPQNPRKTYGYKRAEILAAFINSSALVIFSVLLLFETIKRLFKPEIINADIMLIIGLIGLFANLFATMLLEKESHKSLNIKSSYLHLLSDTLSSLIVVTGAVAIKFLKFSWLDSIITIFICLFIIWESWKIIKKTIDILMQSAANLDYSQMKQEIEAIPGVRNIHHVHTWLGDENTIYLEAHIEMEDMLLSNTCVVAKRIEEILHKNYDIDHITLQFETDQCIDKNFFYK
ncbi:MAG: cation diffusion facilitator family transporter [Brevinematia bacterium]